VSIIDLGTVVTPAYLSRRMDVAKWMVFLKKRSARTYQHSVRLALLAEKLSESLKLDEKERSLLRRGCFLHDIGKTMIPLSILEQRSELTQQQWTIMKLHPILGAELVENDSLENPDVVRTIYHHHERWDGGGYPDGLQGTEIPYHARICAVLDAFDAMMTEQPYRDKFTLSHAVEELRQQSGSQLDGEIVEVFTTTIEQFLDLYHFVSVYD